MKEIEKYFQKINTNNLKDNLIEEYYLLKDDHNELYIKSEFFIMTIFTHGSKWAENLFKDLYNANPKINDIVNQVNNFVGLSVDIEYNNNSFKNAILIPQQKPDNIEENKNTCTEITLPENINLKNVKIRILRKKVPLDFIENLGSGSQFLLSENEKIEVELLQGEKVIGKGVLEKVEEGYSLEITEVQN